uniref:Uncharacterized protein n=1 Tax=Anopheles epiroticus TaxID=199890 RepID=A0A182PBT8_9DIPT
MLDENEFISEDYDNGEVIKETEAKLHTSESTEQEESDTKRSLDEYDNEEVIKDSEETIQKTEGTEQHEGSTDRSLDEYELTNEDYDEMYKQSEEIFERNGASENYLEESEDYTELHPASELDKFLDVIEELSGVAGIASEFDPTNRARMIDDVKQRYNASVGLDQRYFIEAVREVMAEKQLYEGRFELLETLDYVKLQLDILEQSENQEKHYGCYKAGIFFALAIILLLLVGCLPVFLLTTNNNLILLILLVTLLAIGLATFVYLRWQRNRALAMRRTYEQQKFTLTRVHHSSGTATNTAATNATTTNAADSPKDNGIGGAGENITITNTSTLYGQTTAASKLGEPGMGMSATKTDPDGTLQRSTKSPPRYSFI